MLIRSHYNESVSRLNYLSLFEPVDKCNFSYYELSAFRFLFSSKGDYFISRYTIAHILFYRYLVTPSLVAYSFVNTQFETTDFTYCDVFIQASYIYKYLISLGVQKGDRVLLVLPQDSSFIIAFYACLLGGFIAVPLPVPRKRVDVASLENVIHDSRPSKILLTTKVQALVSDSSSDSCVNEHLFVDIEMARKFKVDCLNWDSHLVSANDIAFLQYTSGSTSAPKGVVVRHSNIMSNESMIQRAMNHSVSRTKVLGWLPFFHDMGLIGNVLQPMYLGVTCTLLSSSDVIKNPLFWLHCIDLFKATTSGGPNFMYDLCVEKLGVSPDLQLDLCSWNVAFVGAEPIQASTLNRFYDVFREYGFKFSSFFPCYGMAEATLMITGSALEKSPRILNVDAEKMKQHQVVRSCSDKAVSFVSSGKPVKGSCVCIVDPETCKKLSTYAVGEVWVSGSHITAGYWMQASKSNLVYNCYMRESVEGPFLRTGDLGFLDQEGHLFIVSRLKDIIIINGKNYVPQDIEASVQSSHDALQKHACASFSCNLGNGQPELVVVIELNRHRLKQKHYDDVFDAIRHHVFLNHNLRLDTIILIRTHTIPKTTSGKIQRQKTKTLYQNNELFVVASFNNQHELMHRSDEECTLTYTEQLLCDIVQEVCQFPDIHINLAFYELGIQSLNIMKIIGRIQEECMVEFLPDELLKFKRLTDLAHAIDEKQNILLEGFSSTNLEEAMVAV